MTVGSYLLDRLYQQGVRHIFGVPGDYILQFNKLNEEHAVQFINATRENTAGYMAEAYARLCGLGVVCITYGVGLNIVNTAAQAFAEDTPLIIISGAPSQEDLKRSSFLHHLIANERTQLEILSKVTAYQALLNPNEAIKQIEEAITTAIRLKKPVYIEIPRDVVLAPVTAKKIETPNQQSDPKKLHLALQATQEALQKSKTPFLWLGHQISRENLSSDVETFIEKTHTPFVTSLFGKTALDERHSLFVGVYQGDLSRDYVRQFVNQADCALILGVILSDLDTGLFTAKTDKPQTIIAKDDSVIVNGETFQPVFLKDFVQGLQTIQYKAVIEVPKAPISLPNNTLTAQAVFESLQESLSDNFLIAADIGDSLFGSSDLILPKNSFLSSAYFGTMGFAVPAAIGAQFATSKRAIAIVGDGSFQMTGIELSTAARYHLNPIIIVLNNHGYGTERPLLEGEYNDIHNWDYAAMTQLLQAGISFKVNRLNAFKSALEKAYSSKEFALIEVELGKTDFSDALHRFAKVMKKTVTSRIN